MEAMATSMGPPPPKNPKPETPEPQTETPDEASPSAPPMNSSMCPPPPKTPTSPPPGDTVQSETTGDHEETQPNPPENDSNSTEDATATPTNVKQDQHPNLAVPYKIPEWSGCPSHRYFLEVLKDGSIIDQLDANKKGAYMFGRVDLCDFVLDHPTISRFHAVLQFKSSGEAYLYDLGSTHGTSINKKQVDKKVYVELHVGDVIRFGASSRLYIFQGPSDLMPPEGDLERIRKAKICEDMYDMEASLLRAKVEASLADGVSWGLREDAIEENEEDIEEITWDTFKGQLTEKQEKTRDKVLKRREKIAHMKKEIDAIRVKDISQGGLTQGQQTQIARNEQRMSQIMEELENLEETLNESIRESMGARAGGIARGKKKGMEGDDEDDYISDDDEFYDRTKKPKKKGTEDKSVETADSLLDKKDAISKEMEDKRKLLLDEEGRISSESEVVDEAAGDALDAFMSGLSSQLVVDKAEKLKKELSTLQSELDRVLYLLKIADPFGEAAKKRESKAELPKLDIIKTHAAVVKQPPPQKQTVAGSTKKLGQIQSTNESKAKPEEPKIAVDAKDVKTSVYSPAKPQWLGAVDDKETKKIEKETAMIDVQEDDQFVDYKDRKKILEKPDLDKVEVDSGLEDAAPGLIIRKRKTVEKTDASEAEGSEQSTSSGSAKNEAVDAVALLLKHTRGYYALDDETEVESEDAVDGKPLRQENKKHKKIIGPQKPSFLESDYEAWVPPQGQSGDGRTSLNDRYGY